MASKRGEFPVKRLSILPAFAVLAISCSHGGPCNNVPQRPVAAATPVPEPAPAEEAPKAAVVEKRLPSIQVYKSTGEQQCEASKGIPLDQMRASLTKKKITVYEARTQSDGLMHMTLCGSPAGTIHVFSIPKKNLKAAERLGFKVWTEPKNQ
jgi:hypothetical protein